LLGDASYSLYLWHPLVISALLPLLHIERAPGVLLLPLYLGCSIAVGIASYLLLERPLIGLLAAERQARTDPLTSGA
jgi:exopolysaccharide production protein ExoZ